MIETQSVLSFDVEERFRNEAVAGWTLSSEVKAAWSKWLVHSTRWLLELLDRAGHKATDFIVGQITEVELSLVREIHQAEREVVVHGWNHRRAVEMIPDAFREDLRLSKDVLDQATGAAVVGDRAPTFNILERSEWALDVLAEFGKFNDSSIYSVRHDRYAVPRAPRVPFLALGRERAVLEIPPATLCFGGANVSIGGGGYFRLLPLILMKRAINHVKHNVRSPVATLYFHPWEFDPGQPRLPLRALSRFRTYVGNSRSQGRFSTLLSRHRFASAIDAARQLGRQHQTFVEFKIAA